MNRKAVGLGVLCVLGIAIAATALALFHGYFDRGRFEIKETSLSPSSSVAMVARRSDREAMSGDQYFVVVGDHVFSASELRDAYYGNQVIFRADSDCLSVAWKESHNLAITCQDGSIIRSHIAVQEHHIEDLAVTYINIPTSIQQAK